MNTFVRISVLALALAGIAATSYSQSSGLGATHVAAKLSAGPPPVCPPDGSTDCNIGGTGGNLR